jgi:carbamoyltransferase
MTVQSVPPSYVGIANSFHDSAVAIVSADGQVVFAEATERVLQTKRAINSSPDPFLHIERVIAAHCPPGGEIVLAQPWSGAMVRRMRENQDLQKLGQFIAKAAPGEIPPLLIDQHMFSEFCRASAPPVIDVTGASLRFGLGQAGQPVPGAIRQYDHHLSHAAAACFTSPFEDAACAVIDGYGEGRSYSCYTYSGGRITAIDVPPHPQATSLGYFYMMVCRLCGFGLFAGEEWKVMGLAAYGKHDPAIAALLEPLVRADGLNIVQCSFAETYQIYKKLERYRRRPGEPAVAMADLAHTAQKIFCDVLMSYLDALQRRTGATRVALGGGCLLNSAATGMITERTGFREAHVFSAPADDGNAVGAALLAWREDNPQAPRPAALQSPYLGSELSPEAIERLCAFGGLAPQRLPLEQLLRQTAEALAAGKIVGWAQGRAEYGPRALGNRSILADPRSPGVKQRINAEVKFREEFRPFAPAILEEHAPDYFEACQPTPYMERALRFKPAMQPIVPGVVHVDGTGRLQTVKRAWNPRFHGLISAFHELTGVPILLNTSFNVMGKPIIHSVEDALAVFFTSGIDVLVLGDHVIRKSVPCAS